MSKLPKKNCENFATLVDKNYEITLHMYHFYKQ